MNKNFIISIILILGYPKIVVSQISYSKKQISHTISLQTGFNQYKDQFNYGLVFNGGSIRGKYSYLKSDKNYKFSYTSKLGLDVIHKIGNGFSLNFEPVNLSYSRLINKNPYKPIYLGGYYLMSYNWQFYPSLQSGHMLWVSSLEIGPHFILKPIQGYDNLKISFSNSVFGFISRPKPSTEVYFYSLKFSDFIKNAHSNFLGSSFGTFNHTNLEVELENLIRNKVSLSYEFDFFEYYQDPKFQRVAHSIILKWKL